MEKITSFSEFAIPQAVDIEYDVLAELISDESFYPIASATLNRDCFYDKDAQKAYATLVSMFENHESVDMASVSQRVEKEVLMKLISRTAYATSSSFQSHCSILAGLNQRRKMYFACVKGIQMSCSNDVNNDALIELPTQLAEEMLKGAPKNSTQNVSDVINELSDSLQEGAKRRVPTGFDALDRLVYGGYGEGNLVVLAARPSVGKTSFALQMAREASGKDFSALVLSLEMTNKEVAQRLLFSTHEVGAWEMANGNMNWQNFERAAAKFSGRKLYLDETPQTIDEVCSTITIAHQQGKCDIAYVDYLQLMASPESRATLYQQVTDTTKRMKKLAKNLKIPIVLLCQLNRNSVSENRQPQLHDLRDSGSIEQDADIVLMLERLKNSEGAFTPRVNMYVRKNRGGLAGDVTIELESDNTYTNFVEITKYD